MREYCVPKVLAVSLLLYCTVMGVVQLNEARTLPQQERHAFEPTGPIANSHITIRLHEESKDGVASDDEALSKRNLALRVLAVEIDGKQYPSSDSAWVNLKADLNDYDSRYLNRFEFGRLGDEPDASYFVLETISHVDRVADEARANIWLIDSSKKVQFINQIEIEQAKANPQWRAVFRSTHEMTARAVPTLAVFLIAVAFGLFGWVSFFRKGVWGLFCTLVCFCVPILAGSPLFSSIGWRYFVPAILLSFTITSFAATALAIRMSHRRPERWLARVTTALSVPVLVLIVGTFSAVSFASVSIMPLSGLGELSPGDLFYKTLIRPTQLLFEGGAGTCLLLAFSAGLYRYMMDRKLKQAA